MTNKEIKNVCFNNAGISALYGGDILIWKKLKNSGYVIGYANTPPNNFAILYNKKSQGVMINDGVFKLDIDEEINSLYNMFQFKSQVTLVNLLNLEYSNCTNFGRMFFGCSNLQSIVFNPNCTFSNATDLDNMFCNCTSLTDVGGRIDGIKLDLDLSYSPLTNDSAMTIINGLSDVEQTKILQLKAGTYDSLSEEQIAVATSKGWTVTRQ